MRMQRRNITQRFLIMSEENESDVENLVQMINVCWDGVNKSKVGPILTMDKDNPSINNIGLNAFYTILSNVIPKNLNSHTIIPKEPWE